LIPILRNLILTSDVAKLEAQQAGHRPCTSSRGSYPKGKVYIQHVLTHKEYDRGTWKDD